MKAEDQPLWSLFDGARQYIVPVFQRDYSWGEKHCRQLWEDILRVGANVNAKAHFIGSVVYIAAEDNTASIGRWLLIDGQQRLTTVALLLAALRDRLADESVRGLPSRTEVDDYYLVNRHGKSDRRHKLQLRRADHEALAAVLDGRALPDSASERVRENFEFFRERLEDADLDSVYRGIRKLVVVDVCLTRGQDDPQMIFESLNSTGLDLTQADLIRNFVLMRQEDAAQTRLYYDYWQPIEAAFGVRYSGDFDKFVRDFLALKLQPSRQFKADSIYQHFRAWFQDAGGPPAVERVLADLKRFGGYFVSFSHTKETRPQLREPMGRLRLLVEVASTLVQRLYDCHDRAGTLTLDEFVEAIELLESYVFRRSVCAMQTRNLAQIFASLAYRIRDDQPLVSLKVALGRSGKNRRFPTDAEFREALETRDVYDMRQCKYLLDRLENDSKERIDTSGFSIEHVMPQNDDLCAEWREMLGSDWRSVQATWLHRLGNVTLTGYNSEYRDRPFAEKQRVQNGFAESPLRLNKFIREQTRWTPVEMESRSHHLVEKALRIWAPLEVDAPAARAAEIAERRSAAAMYNIETLNCDEEARALLDFLRPRIAALGDDVVELFSPKTVTYRVYEFFAEIIPRTRWLTLLLNLELEDCQDPSGKARGLDEDSIVRHATEVGGVVFDVRTIDDIPTALYLVRQAHEKATE